MDNNPKIAVFDLDHTLIKSDMLYENLLAMIKVNFLYLLLLPVWLAKGLPYLKKRVFELGNAQPENLPYNTEVLQKIEKLKVEGYKVYLATASTQGFAEKVNQHLDLFDDVFGSSPTYNLKGKNKKNFLDDKFGIGNYIYAGDSTADLQVWNGSNGAIVVGKSDSFVRRVAKITKIESVIPPSRKSYIKVFIKQIRVYQWVKNILMFLPILTAHNQNPSDYLTAFWAFLSFSAIASSVYVTNDLLDLNADRHHPRKSKRPLASGDMPLLHGLLYAPLLLLIGYAIAVLMVGRSEFVFVLTVYYAITTAYSFILKRIAIMDILVLAILYTIRIIAGTAATGISTSEWLLAFTMFIFISLAVVKRYTELIVMKKDKKSKIMGRGYNVDDASLLLSIGPASGYLSVLVFTLYVNSSKVATLYDFPTLLWAIAPFLLFWITRMWLLAHRGEMTDDPIVFTVKDKYSYIIGFFVLLIALSAKLFHSIPL